MNSVVRNLVVVVASVAVAAVVSFGLFAVVVAPPPPTTPITPPGNGGPGPGPGTGNGNATNPALPPGAQVAFGSANGVTPPGSSTNPNLPSDALGGVQTGANSAFATDYSANYAAQSAVILQKSLETNGLNILTYDPVLGQAAANLVADTVANGQATLVQSTAVNSQGLSPIQQVLSIAPASTVTSVSVLSYVSDALVSSGDATNPAQGLAPALSAFLNDPIFNNQGWTHYGFAVVTVPTSGQFNARRYYVIFFARE
ncbi:MAG TPA: hypothetical protein VE988_10165 [Gemmataceae bacterium]|nr:hypothetical protein [Gemmataceae bacterium]